MRGRRVTHEAKPQRREVIPLDEGMPAREVLVLDKSCGHTVSGAGCKPFANESPSLEPAGSPDLGSRIVAGVTSDDDVATLAGQLADLTRVVEDMARQITAIRDRAVDEQEATDAQQDRIELAARELADVSSRLQAAADALRTAI